MRDEARLNVRIDKQLLTAARVKAIQSSTTVSDIVRDLLTHYTATTHNTVCVPLEREACVRIAARAGSSALSTIRGPIAHQIGYLVWHFTSLQHRARGRVRYTFRNHLTGERIPGTWQVYWDEEPLKRPPAEHQEK